MLVDEEKACKEVLAYLILKNFIKTLLRTDHDSAFVAGMCYAEIQKVCKNVLKRNNMVDRAALLSSFHAAFGVLKRYAR